MRLATRTVLLRSVSVLGLIPLMMQIAPAMAASAPDAGPPADAVLLQADMITADRANKIVIAKGHVEAAQGKRVVVADTLTYSEQTGRIIAEGQVSLVDDGGNVSFSDRVELDRSLAEGVANAVRLLMADNSRLVAAKGNRLSPTLMTLDKAIYSSCNLCKDDPTAAPLWQLRAAHVTKDDTAKRISYEDARLEFYGVPVFYTPYFSHPDPSVARESGLLTPSIGSSSDLGYRLTLPYLYVIDPSTDVVLAPTYASQAGYGLLGDYRQRFQRGVVDLSGSFLEADRSSGGPGQQLRGHLFAYGRFEFLQNWQTGFTLERASDDTYLRRFSIANATTLTTSAFAERFTRNSALTVDNYWFQGLRAQDVTGAIPYVAPLVDYRHYGEPGFLGSRFDYQINALDLVRPSGRNTRRLGATTTWAVPFTSQFGELYKITARFDGNGYWVTSRTRAGQPIPATDRTVGVAEPSLTLDWRWPLVRNDGNWRQVIEPIGQAIAAPYFGRFDRIPNEDSTNVEFDDSNLFSFSRYGGRDRMESGPRANVGGQWSLYGPNGGLVSALFGQTYRLKPDRTLNREAGLGATRSDYVGRVTVSPAPWLDFIGRVRLDPDNFSARRTEVQVDGGPTYLRGSLGYLDIDADRLDTTIPARRELRASLFTKPLEHYYLTASATRNLIGDGRWISYATGIFYTDECFETGLVFQRNNVLQGDLKPSTAINLIIRLKSLGQSFELPNIGVGGLVGVK